MTFYPPDPEFTDGSGIAHKNGQLNIYMHATHLVCRFMAIVWPYSKSIFSVFLFYQSTPKKHILSHRWTQRLVYLVLPLLGRTASPIKHQSMDIYDSLETQKGTTQWEFPKPLKSPQACVPPRKTMRDGAWPGSCYCWLAVHFSQRMELVAPYAILIWSALNIH